MLVDDLSFTALLPAALLCQTAGSAGLCGNVNALEDHALVLGTTGTTIGTTKAKIQGRFSSVR